MEHVLTKLQIRLFSKLLEFLYTYAHSSKGAIFNLVTLNALDQIRSIRKRNVNWKTVFQFSGLV